MFTSITEISINKTFMCVSKDDARLSNSKHLRSVFVLCKSSPLCTASQLDSAIYISTKNTHLI